MEEVLIKMKATNIFMFIILLFVIICYISLWIIAPIDTIGNDLTIIILIKIAIILAIIIALYMMVDILKQKNNGGTKKWY